ncbi:unnamed protein product [Rangifer tarandus platyrhynchus]|uniref:Uncharacterized protein n=2 Tax=Rangifer tarandus platyrhynchus TaxID=3082113 RepID=A0ABN8ZKR3_RANTA|nr:unnamed protein product [Rangifer tarandus platyrhynchus]
MARWPHLSQAAVMRGVDPAASVLAHCVRCKGLTQPQGLRVFWHSQRPWDRPGAGLEPGSSGVQPGLGDQWDRELVRDRLWARKNSPEPQVCCWFLLLSCLHLSCLVTALSRLGAQ